MSVDADPSLQRDVELRKFVKKELIILAPLCFSLILLLDWSGITDGGFPSTSSQTAIQVSANVVQTAFLLIVSYFVLTNVFKRFPPKGKPLNREGD
jgi:hypothetical protein